MKLKPLHDYVIVRREKKEGEEVRSGIIVPGAKDDTKIGTVEAVGKDTAGIVKVGDRVIFIDYFDKILVDGEEYWTGKEKDIAATLT